MLILKFWKIIMKWKTEEITILRELSALGWTNKQISDEFGWSIDSIKHYKSKNNIRSAESNKRLGGRGTEYTKEILIEALILSECKTQEYFNNPANNLPNPSTYRRFFGSWTNALIEAGLDPNKCSIDPCKVTKLYLVEFEEGFYKIGITQRTVKHRLSGYPKFSIVLELEMTYEEAIKTEKEWLSAVSEFKFIPNNFPKNSGRTECFKY